MTRLTVARIAVWAVAALALAGAGYAYWQWQLLEFLIATGVFIICQPISAALRHEQRSRAACSPFGPVCRFGYNEDAAHRGIPALSPNAQHSADDVRRIVRGRGWRATWQRLTPWWTWILLLAIAPSAIALATSPTAAAGPVEDYSFIATLDEFGVLYSSEPAAIAAGMSVCQQLDTGASIAATVRTFMDAGYDRADAQNLVGAAIGAYCPEHAGITTTAPAGVVGGAVQR